jgi:hypothetical protein
MPIVWWKTRSEKNKHTPQEVISMPKTHADPSLYRPLANPVMETYRGWGGSPNPNDEQMEREREQIRERIRREAQGVNR